jgi:hypothetical protein
MVSGRIFRKLGDFMEPMHRNRKKLDNMEHIEIKLELCKIVEKQG